jgi:RHS repeat-associated protein
MAYSVPSTHQLLTTLSVETIGETSPAPRASAELKIPAGQTLHLVASGDGLIAKYQGRGLDAEYGQRPAGAWYTSNSGGFDWGIGTTAGKDLTWSTDGYHSDHIYGTTISAGSSDRIVALKYWDDYYNDNAGVLTVSVYAPAPSPTTPPPIDKPTEGEPCQKCQNGICSLDMSTGESVIYSGTIASASNAGRTPPARFQLNQTTNDDSGIGGMPASGEFGDGWSRTDTARLVMQGTDPDAPDFVSVAFSSTDTRVFRRFSDGSFARAHGLGSTDTLALEGASYVFRTASGTTRTFNSFTASLPALARGALASHTDSSGNRIEYSFGVDGATTGLASFIAGQATAVEIQDYVHLPVGNPNAGKVGQIDIRRGDGTLERAVEFSYYDGTSSFGALGQLASITARDAAAAILDAWNYRYAIAPSGASLLQYALDSEASRRAIAAGLDLLTAANTAIAPFATAYLEYDAQNRVTRQDIQGAGCSSCTGGIGTFAYAYATNAAAGSDLSAWLKKTTETRPDGTERIVYANGRTQTMLEVIRTNDGGTSSTKQYGTFTRYDARGQAIWNVSPEAIALPTDLADIEQYADLLNEVNGNFEFIHDATGLIEVTNYAPSTTATATTPGTASRFVSSTAVMRGDVGAPIFQSAATYFVVTAGESSVTPVATRTTYPNATTSGGLTTTYAYEFTTGTTQIVSQATSKPIVTSSQNGPGTADVSTTVFDAVGRPIWSKDPDGFLRYTEYDETTGSVVKSIADVDTTQASSFENLPAGWATPTTGGLHLVTAYEVDALGRTTTMTDANGNITYTVYDDANHSMRTYRGWNASTNLPTGPIEISRRDLSGNYTETLTFAATPDIDGSGRPTGTEAITNIQTLSRSILNDAGQMIAQDRYVSILAYSTAPTIGTAGINFLRTTYAYSNQGKVDRIQNPAGTITLLRHDGLARQVNTYVGTDDSTTDGFKWSPSNASASSNMVLLSTNEYDNGGVGNSNMTSTTQFPGGGADPRTTQYAVDWRNRVVVTKAGATATPATEDTETNRPLTFVVYDNLGRRTGQSVYDGDGVEIVDANSDGVPDAPAAALLRSSQTVTYDAQSRGYRTTEFSVDQSTGAIATPVLTTNLFFDRRGNLAMRNSPTSPVVQQRYDGAGRMIATYTLGNVPGTNWANAVVLTNAVVVEQYDNVFDSVGSTILTVTRQRFHDQSTTTKGALGTPTTGIKARVSYVSGYFDAANRMTDSVNVGTNGGAIYVRPGAVPIRSDSVLVTSYEFDEAGRVQDVMDPRGIVARSVHDPLGRTVVSVLNYTGGAAGAQTDVTTTFDFDSSGQLASRTAVQPAGTPSQVTGYVYGVSAATGSGIASNDIMAETRYPDRVTGLPSASDAEVFTVNALGERLTFTDRAGSTHAYTRDIVGRQTANTVVTLGAGVDGGIRRIDVAYETLGQAQTITSFDAVTGASPKNQLARAFAAFGKIASEAQAHTGLVDASTPKVQYLWSQGIGGNHDRLTKTIYPDGTQVNVNYAGLDSAMSRITSLSGAKASDGTSVVLEAIKYLGASTVVERSRPEVNVNLTLVNPTGAAGPAGDKYQGLDLFGRVADQNWVLGTGVSAVSVDRTQYSHDRNSNRATATNALNAAFNETYTHDALNQLETFERGAAGSPTDTQDWQFDALGNWTTNTIDGVAENRTANAQNELTDVGGAALTYSPTGNLTTDAEGRTLEYDAWNRLIRVTSADGLTWTEYTYNGLNHRIVEAVSGPFASTRDLYYSLGWQVLEERVRDGMGEIPATADTRYVWSPVYIDAMIARDRNADSDTGTGTGGLEQRIYAIQDANWNTTAIVAASGVLGVATGNVVYRFVYSPYGASETLTASWTTPASPLVTTWRHLFQGLKFTEATGLAYVRNRDYSATLGRFIERDPIGFTAGDNNWYRMVRNAPTTWTDPSGLDIQLDCYSMCNKLYPHWWQYHLWVGCTNGCDVGAAGVNGGDVTVDAGVLVGVGVAKVWCCDDKGASHSVLLQKSCYGVLAGVSVAAHALSNISGSNCPTAYTGWFFEWGAGIGVAGVGGAIGVGTTDPARVGAGGGYVGLGIPVEAKLCKYTLVDDIVKPCGCKTK